MQSRKTLFPQQQNFALGSFAQMGSGVVPDRFGANTARSSGGFRRVAVPWLGSRRFWCRYLVRFQMFPVQLPDEVPEGIGGELYTPHLNSSPYTPDSTFYTLHSKFYIPHFTPPILNSALHTLHYTLSTPHSTLHTPHFTLYTLHSTLYTLHCTLYTLHLTISTLHFTLYTLHFIFHTPQSPLQTLGLYAPHSPLNTPFFSWSTFGTPTLSAMQWYGAWGKLENAQCFSKNVSPKSGAIPHGLKILP